MDEKMAALDENATWDLVQLPKDKKCIGCNWVYKVKHNADGNVSRYKARLVAKGYVHTHEFYFEETFSSIANMGTIWAMIALDASKGWILH